MITLDMDVLNATHELWAIDPNDKKARRALKGRKFDYVTFSGTFTIRRSDGLKQHSGLLCIDLDHVEKEPRNGEKRRTVWEVKQLLAADPEFETALCFRSPSADGVKWVVVIDLDRGTHREWFYAICKYLEDKHGLEVDTSGKDVTRPCYLPHDPQAIIGEQFRKKFEMIRQNRRTDEEIPF